ncbi:MAG: CARDB domain-containing protein, partial [Chloroflexota bacterium]|nr:CARDB domain-containing protein [Chloroflexota bacterium]
SVVYTHTLTNGSNAADTFDLVESSSQGWPVVLSTISVTLDAYEAAQVVVIVTVPSSATVGSVDTTIVTATSQFDPAYFALVTDTTSAVPHRDLIFTPDYQRAVDPGAVEYYRHTLTNTGDITDTFVITWTDAAVWTSVEPEQVVELPAGVSAPVTVTVTVPAGTLSGTSATAWITATSENDLAANASVVDVTTVQLVREFTLSAGMSQNAIAGDLVSYVHQVTNSGNYTDTFSAALTSTQVWTVTVAPEILSLAAGATAQLTLSVQAPEDALTDTVEETALTVSTQSLPVLSKTVTDTTTIVEAPTWTVYLPLIMRNYNSDAPDLVVTALDAVLDGGNYLISVTVKNQGPQPVAYGNNFYVDFYVDNIPERALPGAYSWGVQGDWFGVGESRVLTTTYHLAVGTHQLYAQADTDNTVVEANEANNVLGPRAIVVTSSVQVGNDESELQPVVTPLPGPRPTPTAIP